MTLQELQQAIDHFSVEEQLSLLETLVHSLKARQQPAVDRHRLVNQLRGCLKKPGQPIPTDADIEAMREERRTMRYSDRSDRPTRSATSLEKSQI